MYTTDRLVLKTADEINVEDIMEYYRENKQHLKPYEPIREEGFYTYRNQSIQLSYDLEHLKNHTGLKLFITKSERNRIIGILNFSQIVMGGFCSCYLGYGLDEHFVGHGIMTEALEKGIKIMFEDYGLHRIEGNVMPRNTKSIAVLKKFDFEEEGLAKRYLKINGVWEDHIHYVLLNE